MERQLAAVLKMSLEASQALPPAPPVPLTSPPPSAPPLPPTSGLMDNDPSLQCIECEESDDDDDDDDDERTGEVTCSICCEDKPVEDFKGRLAAGCSHLREICDLCAVRHIRAEVNGKGNVTLIRCPHA